MTAYATQTIAVDGFDTDDKAKLDQKISDEKLKSAINEVMEHAY